MQSSGAARGGKGGRGGVGSGGRPEVAPRSREERKDSRRSKQQAAEAARDKAEDEYFKQCQAQALKSGEAQKAAVGLSGREADEKEKSLFAQQGAQGIQFDKYADIKVSTSGPGADAAPPFDDFSALELPACCRRVFDIQSCALIWT